MVLRSKRHARLMVETMFLEGYAIKPHESNEATQDHTHCKVGTIPLTPCPAPGVAAGVVGVTPLPLMASPPLDCCPVYALAPFAWTCPSFSEGGVRSPAPPGKDKLAGEVKAEAWIAVEGCVLREASILSRSEIKCLEAEG